MSKLTTVGITCNVADIPMVLGLNVISNIRLERQSVGVEHFALFTVVLKDIEDEVLTKLIGRYKSTLWLYPDSCTMIMEGGHIGEHRFIVLPDTVAG
jgi:hypothetical protein